jgi:hypothetical protein
MMSQNMNKQRGSAMTEFIAMGAVLVPLFLAIPLIGKYHDIGHAAQVTARNAAWRSTIVDAGISGKNISAADRQQLDAQSAGVYFANGEVQFGNYIFHDQTALIADPENDISLQSRDGASPSSPFSTQPAALVRSRLGVNESPIRIFEASVNTVAAPRPLDTIAALTIRRHAATLTSPWTAVSGADTQSKINDGVLAPSTLPLYTVANQLVSIPNALLELGLIPTAPRVGDTGFWSNITPIRDAGLNPPQSTPQPSLPIYDGGGN